MTKLESLVKNANKLHKLDLFNGISPEDKEYNRVTVECSNMIMRARKAARMSQKQLAEIIGVTQSAVSQWESGDSNFSISTLVKVLAALDVRLSITGKPMGQVEYDGGFSKTSSYKPLPSVRKNNVIPFEIRSEERERM